MESQPKRPRDDCLYEAAVAFLAYAQYEQDQNDIALTSGTPSSSHLAQPEVKKLRLCDSNQTFSFSLPRSFPSVTPDLPLPPRTPPSSWHELRAFNKRVKFEPWPTLSVRATAIYHKLKLFLDCNKDRLVSLLQIVDNLSSSVQMKPMVSVHDLIHDSVVNDTFLAVREIRENLEKCAFSTDNAPSIFSPCEPLRTELYENFITFDNCSQSTAIPAPVSAKPAFKIMSADDERHTLPQASVTIVPPSVALAPLFLERNDSNEVASAFQVLFEEQENDLSPQESKMVASLAEGITHALHTRTGLGIIFSHNEALFIEVAGVEPLIRERILVRISQPFCCDHRVNTIFGIAAFFQVVELRGATDKLFDSNVVEAMQFISQAAIRIMKLNSFDEESESDDGTEENQGGVSPIVRPDVNEQEGSNMFLLEHARTQTVNWKDNGDNAPDRRTRLGLQSPHNAVESNAGMATVIHTNCETVSTECVPTLQWMNNDLVSVLLEQSWGVLGSGGCGMVKKGTYRSTDVAIKYWNRRHRSGEKLLWREIGLYCELATRCSDLLGSVIPRLVVVGRHAWVGCVLITEQVGESVKAVCGHIRVGGQIVSQSDINEIRESAVDGLVRLHTVAGLLHRDVELRNLRAEWVYEDQKGTWRTWWLDFGLAKPCNNIERMAEEVEHCRRIFDEGNTDARPVVPL